MNYKRLFSILAVSATLCLTVAPTAVFAVDKPVQEVPAGPIIDQFLAMLDGTEAKATAAIAKFGSAEVIANKMIPFGKNPKIIKTDGNCVHVALQDDEETNVYVLCEENGKITTFEWYLDDEEE